MNASQPRISIIVPVYNVEKYLATCLDSILSQTYKNLEIILVDDGSTDSSSEICDNYSKKDDRIKVIHKANGGVSDTRNIGVKAATSEFIMFLDADDWADENFVNRMHAAITSANADIAMCSYFEVYGDKVEIPRGRIKKNRTLTGRQAVVDSVIDSRAYYNVLWNKIYRSEILKDKDIVFPVGKINEENYTVHKMLDKCEKVAYISDSLVYYRQNREDSVMFNASKDTSYIDNIRAFTDEQLEYLDAKISRRDLDTIDMMCDYLIVRAIAQRDIDASVCFNESLRQLRTNLFSLMFKSSIPFAKKMKVLYVATKYRLRDEKGVVS